MEQLAFPVAPRESVTCAIYEYVATAVGVPVTAPVLVFKVNPGGSDPLVMEKVYGGVPPVATNEELYGTPICATDDGQASAGGGNGIGVAVICHKRIFCAPLPPSIKVAPPETGASVLGGPVGALPNRLS